MKTQKNYEKKWGRIERMENKNLFNFLLKAHQISTYENFDLFKGKVISLSNELSGKLEKEYEKCSSKNNEGFFNTNLEDLLAERDSYKSELYKSLIILFYSESEIRLKEILKLHCSILEKSKGRRQFSMINSLKYKGILNRFQKKLSLNLTNFSGEKELNEIRLLNNCVKHSGKVSKELSNTNQMKWKQNGEPIVLDLEYIEKLIDSSKKFILAIVNKLLEG